MKDSKIPNEADILAINEKLAADLAAKADECATLASQLQTLTAAKDASAKQVAEANTKVTELQTATATLTKERDELKAANSTLESQTKDFNARLAAELSKHGIRTQAAQVKTEAERKLTLTEQCQAAKGAK